MFTLGQAAKETGKSKATLSRDIKKGKLSATKNEDGSYRINPAELFRVYKKINNSGTVANGTPETGETYNKIERLQTELNFKDEKITSLENQLQEVKADRAKWQKQAESVTALLTHQKEKPQQEVSKKAQQPQQMSFWNRLLGK